MRKCNTSRGWKCIRKVEHSGGPCAAVPCWWNIPALIRFGWMR